MKESIEQCSVTEVKVTFKSSVSFARKRKKKQPKTWHKLVTAQPSNNNVVHMVLSIFLVKLDFTGFFCFVFSQHFLQPSNLEVSSLMFSVL